VLGKFDAADDIVIQEGIYTFFRQSVDAKKCISYLRESDWCPNAAFENEVEWPTSWVEPTREWATTEWDSVHDARGLL
jgi:hypothetical protein